MIKSAKNSQIILNTLKDNVKSFQDLLEANIDDATKQNLLRTIILFSCAGIDAIVKQLIIESLE